MPSTRSNNSNNSKQNKRVGIPIPSFSYDSSPSTSSSTATNNTSDNDKKAANAHSSSLVVTPANSSHHSHSTTTTTTIPAEWNVAALMQLEVSLQHWFRRAQQRKHKTCDNNNMSLNDFFALVQKLDWSQTTTVTSTSTAGVNDESAVANANDEETQQDKTPEEPNNGRKKKEPFSHAAQLPDFTWEERLLHDLLCAAAAHADRFTTNTSNAMVVQQPLYRLRFLDNNHDNIPAVKRCSLEAVPHSSDQWRKALACTDSFSKSASDEIVRHMVQYRRAKENTKNVHNKLKNSSDNSKIPKPLPTQQKAAVITKGMTVDERVRARAQAKQEYEQQLLQDQKDANNNNNNKELSDHTIDTMWMIQMADALWTHSRTLLQRQNCHLPGKLASNSILHPSRQMNAKSEPNTTTTSSVVSRKCVMTFPDVVRITAKSRLGEASSLQIAKVLTELEKYSPRWITILRDPAATASCSSSRTPNHNTTDTTTTKHSNKSSFQWRKSSNTTIFITPDQYPAVRSQLTGRPHGKHSKIELRIQQQVPATTNSSKKRGSGGMATASKAMANNDANNQNCVTHSLVGKAKKKSNRLLLVEDSNTTTTCNRKRSLSPVPGKNLLQVFDKDSKRLKPSSTS